jgi:acetoin utilization deacetylase AcuC-like enzyme
MARRLFYCDHYEIPLPPGHKFPVRKYRLLRDLLAADGFYRLEQAPLADPATIVLTHDPAYVRSFLDGTLEPAVMRRIGFPWSEGLLKRTLASVGGTLSATADAVADGFGGSLAGGTHHAFRSEGSGFCVFNDIAVAIHWLRKQAAVVDLDVHQGDGTAEMFADDPSVLTLSIHARNNFPFRKRPSKIDVSLADGAADAEYLRIVEETLPRVFAFSPEIVFYQSGVDGLATDVLGRLSLTHSGLRERDRLVMEACRRHAVPLVVTLGGGYSEPIELTAEAHANTFRIASQVFGRCSQKSTRELKNSLNVW